MDKNFRYLQQIILPQVGLLGQKKLSQTKVLCVGAGGLGCASLTYLTAGGIGSLGICDGDVISLHNLQRQVLYTENDIGKLKSSTAINRLYALNKEIVFIDIPEALTSQNALAFITPYDYIVDGSDNFTTKLILNDACHYLQKPLISASVYQLQGQCSVFWYPHGPCWRCLFPFFDNESLKPNCNEGGILGMLAGSFGMLQALEVIKLCLKWKNNLLGRLWYWDVLNGIPQVYEIAQNPDCPLCTGKTNFVNIWCSSK